jgi:hypothetical protein
MNKASRIEGVSSKSSSGQAVTRRQGQKSSIWERKKRRAARRTNEAEKLMAGKGITWQKRRIRIFRRFF